MRKCESKAPLSRKGWGSCRLCRLRGLFTPSDPAMPGHLPHLATAKQGRLEFFDSLKHRPKGRCFFARIAAFGGWNAGDGVPYSKNCRATPPGVAG